MQIALSRYTDLSLLLTACITLNGFQAKESESATDTRSATMSVEAANTSTGRSVAVPSSAALSDANIVALLDEANMADSALGAMALPKATRADVKSFAKLMMGEHHALRLAGQNLAKKESITPQMPADDPFTSAVQAEQSAVGAAAKGHAFDSTYIAHEIGIHQAVIAWAGTAETEAQNQPLKDLIKSAGPVLQKHLDQAQAIQKRLNKMTS
jgi:putative membrane protein